MPPKKIVVKKPVAQGTCGFKKGEIVRCKNTGIIYVSTGTALRKFDAAGWKAVLAKRPGLKPRDASCSNIASCKAGEPATAKNVESNLALVSGSVPSPKTTSPPKNTSAPTKKPAAPGTCSFKKGEIVRCKNTGIIYVSTGTALRKFDEAGWKAMLAKRPGLKPRDASCSNIASCKAGEPATAKNVASNLAIVSSSTTAPAATVVKTVMPDGSIVTTQAPAAPFTSTPGPVCQPRTTGAPVLPTCTEAPTDFEKTTCNAAGGRLVPREMYGQTFAYCVFPNGSSCQVDDIASGWCSAPTQPPLTQAPTPPAPVQPPPWMQQAPQNNRQNQLLGLLPGLFGGAGSNVAGNDTSGSGGGTGLGFATVGADGAAAGMDPSAATKFFGDQTGMANTGSTPEIVAKLAAQQQYDTTGLDRVPQPVPIVMPGTTPQGPPGDTGLATSAPLGAVGGEEAALAQIKEIMDAKTAAPTVDETAFFRLKNPILWILVSALISVVFILFKKYSLNKAAAAQSVLA